MFLGNQRKFLLTFDVYINGVGCCVDVNNNRAPWVDKTLNSVKLMGVSTVGYNAFYGHAELKNVEMGSTVKQVRDGGFENTGLTNVVIPDSVTSLGNLAFTGNNLAEIVLTDSISNVTVDALVGSSAMNVVCKGQNCDAVQAKLLAAQYNGAFRKAIDDECNDEKYYYTGSECIKEPDVNKRTCKYERTGYIKIGNYCASPEVTYAKKRYTPAEAAQWLRDDDNNTVVLTFKK